MLARFQSAVIVGVEAHLVNVEVDVAWGLPSFTIVGLPDTSVRESRDRVRSAIRNCGFEFPAHRVTVNLAPADLPKAGSSFDLPIALGVLAADGHLAPLPAPRVVVLGELSLDGRIHAARGVLPIAAAARKASASGILVPVANAAEAAVVGALDVYPVGTLPEAVAALQAPDAWKLRAALAPPPPQVPAPDLADVRGQMLARRALEIAAAGEHHLLMIGPPGAGKTMLARRLPGILPTLDLDEALEVTTIHSVAGLLPGPSGLVRQRPFRAPHHTISDAALVGGGAMPRPGEISLSHHGVLFLDEAAEFSRRSLETLRQPLEEGAITIARAARVVHLPARFQLVAATNPCPCGHRLSAAARCSCTPPQVAAYRARLSGPLRDRLDLVVHVPPVDPSALLARAPGESSEAVRSRVLAARAWRRHRGQAHQNARLEGEALDRWCALDAEGTGLVEEACRRLGASARWHTRVRRVARTIADLDRSEQVKGGHVAEALQFRDVEAG